MRWFLPLVIILLIGGCIFRGAGTVLIELFINHWYVTIPAIVLIGIYMLMKLIRHQQQIEFQKFVDSKKPARNVFQPKENKIQTIKKTKPCQKKTKTVQKKKTSK